jgi:MSP (Major sperm protein) domain
MASIEPSAAQFPAAGGVSSHQLVNPGETRLAFKIKTTNNEHYRMSAVYGFIEPGASTSIDITRLVGPLLNN